MKPDLKLFKVFAKTDNQAPQEEGLNCVIYTRVSTKEQDNNYSLETQRKHCIVQAERKGYDVLQFFGGTYESAQSDERKEFQRMLQYVKRCKRKVHVIVVYNFDRFSRSGANAIYIASELKKRMIAVESVTQPTEAFTPGGELQQNIYFSFSQYENQVRRKRMMDGTKEALLKGKWPTKPPLGYSVVTESGKRQIIINEKGKLLKRAFKWKLKGELENTEIVKRLNAAGMSMYAQKLHKIFANPFYCGLMVHRALNGDVVEGSHPPIISRQDFLKINGMVHYSQNRTAAPVKEYPDTPLRLFIYCDCCGKPLTAYSRTKKTKKLKTKRERAEYTYSKPYHYYKCRTTGCRMNIRAEDLHTLFLEQLTALQIPEDTVELAREFMQETFRELNADHNKLVRELKTNLKKVEDDIDELEERLFRKEVPLKIYEKFSRKLEEDKFKIMEEMDKVGNEISNPQEFIDNALHYAVNLPKLWENEPFWKRQKLQKKIFPEGLHFDPQNRKFRTPNVNPAIAQISRISQRKGQKERGFMSGNTQESPSAERGGFEPPVPVSQHACLANRWFQPLTHLSG